MALAVFNSTIDEQSQYLLEKMRYYPDWPNASPNSLRENAKRILKRIWDVNEACPLTNPQRRRVEQFVARVDGYCWQKGLPALPVDWDYPITL
jgi:hypothetical protein